MYKKARAGEKKNYTDIDSLYEAPVNSEIILNTDVLTVTDAADKITKYLEI